jgi:hypothetical protein
MLHIAVIRLQGHQMTKSQKQRNDDYLERNELKKFSLIAPAGTRERLKELAARNQTTPGKMLEMLLDDYGQPAPEINRHDSEVAEAVRVLTACKGDYAQAVRMLAAEYKAINPSFVYTQRPGETPEATELRMKFTRIRVLLYYWKKKGKKPSTLQEAKSYDNGQSG